MERKPLRVAIALSLALALALICACAPRFVGEERAKTAGLTLLRQAFGVRFVDAHVEYVERAGTSVLDNTEVPPDANRIECIYIVTISDQSMGADLYYAEVDAKSGVAYYATKNEWLLAPLSEDQQQQTTEINNLTDGADADAAVQNDYTEHTARNAAMRCFQKEVALISAKGCCRRDNVLSPRVSIGYFVTFADGALYRVAFSWPAMDMNEVQVLGTEAKGERP